MSYHALTSVEDPNILRSNIKQLYLSYPNAQ